MNESKIKGSYKGFEDDPTFGMNATQFVAICSNCIFSGDNEFKVDCRFFSIGQVGNRVKTGKCEKKKIKK